MQITSTSQVSNINHKRWFRIFITCHLILWTTFPTIFRPTIMHDVAEGITWGWQWQLGYDKHPPLAAWLCALFTNLFSTVGWPVYLLAQIAVVIAFWAVWRLALRITSPLYALISVFSLEGIVCFNAAATKFTPDTIQTPIWAVMILLFYITLKEKKLWQWVLLGVLAGIAVWSKYQAPILFISMFACMLITQQGRDCFKQLGPYLTAITCLVVITPHIVWAYHYHFPEISYMLNSTTGKLHSSHELPIIHYLSMPLMFTLNQVGVCTGLIIMFIPFYFAKKENSTVSQFDKTFLCIMALGPFAISVLYALITGSALIHRWSMPYFSLLGLYVLIMLRPHITQQIFKSFIRLFLVVALSILIGRYTWIAYIGPYWAHNAKADAYYPAKPLALWVTRYWHQHYHSRLRYIAGSHYVTAYVTAYSPDRPTPLMGFDERQSEWININTFRKQGGMLIWRIKSNQPYALPGVAKSLFQNAKLLPELSLPKLTQGTNVVMHFGVAVVPPK